jgi:hypothetical protein
MGGPSKYQSCVYECEIWSANMKNDSGTEFPKLLLLFPLMLLVSCGGGGASSSSAVGANSVATMVQQSAPLGTCPTGGITVDVGIDSNGNGILDTSEVGSTQYVCNGANGSDGLTTLVSISNEGAGTNCAAGGKKIEAGQDGNSNGVLDVAEVDVALTAYVCNGPVGAAGNDGLNTLVSIATEPAGVNCTYGGHKVSEGLDSNVNATLDDSEVTSHYYVCDGAPGPTGPAGPTGPTGPAGPAGIGISWVNITGTTQQAAANTGYLANSPSKVSIVLPGAPSLGDIVQVTGVGAGGWEIAQNSGQSVITKNLPNGFGSLWSARDSARNWSGIALSADGSKQVATENGGQIYTSTDTGATWTPRESTRNWSNVASSADGSKLVAVVNPGQIYVSADSGATWTPRESVRNWSGIAMSADGSKQVATVNGGQIYTSPDTGATWTPQESNRSWSNVASSSDGIKLVAVVNPGQIYISADSGVTWTPHESNRTWNSVASSADGVKLVAVADFGQIFTSTDSGVTWTPREWYRSWQDVTSSSDGTRLLATVYGGQIYASTDSGVTWVPGESTRNWFQVASSSDGTTLAATEQVGQIYTSTPSTTVGIAGSITGGQYDALTLQCVGNNTFAVTAFAGNFVFK